jgi:ATP-binding cassette subfamily B protein
MTVLSALNEALNRVGGRANGRLLDAAAWRYLKPYLISRLPQLLGYVVAASVQSLLTLPIFFLVRFAFDRAIPDKDIGLLIGIGAAMVAFRALNSLIGLALRAFIVRIIKQIAFDMRSDLLLRLYRLSRQYHARADASLLHARIVQDTERVDTMCNALFSGILPALLSSVVLFGFLVYLNWWLVLLSVCVLPLLWIGNAVTGRLVKRHVQAFQKAFEGFSRGTLFVLRHMDLTRLQAFEREEVDRQRNTLGVLRDTGNQMSMSYAIHNHVQRNITGLAGVILLVAGGSAVAHGSMTLGGFLAFFVAAGILNGAVDTVLGGIPNIITGNESLVILQKLMGDGQVDPYQGTKTIEFDGTIQLSGVGFDYGGQPILEDIDLEIACGDVIALIGPNGVGKTTIVHIILGLLRPNSGTLQASGHSYDDIEMPSLRRAIGVVPQYPTFFTGTVRENICYGRPDATEQDIRAALEVAQATDYVASLPLGLDTEIGDNAILTSGGEKQRLAVARALISRPKLLILDEPTNHLDVSAMTSLMAALVGLPERPGILIISHTEMVLGFAKRVYEIRDHRLHQTQAHAAAPATVTG